MRCSSGVSRSPPFLQVQGCKPHLNWIPTPSVVHTKDKLLVRYMTSLFASQTPSYHLPYSILSDYATPPIAALTPPRAISDGRTSRPLPHHHLPPPHRLSRLLLRLGPDSHHIYLRLPGRALRDHHFHRRRRFLHTRKREL